MLVLSDSWAVAAILFMCTLRLERAPKYQQNARPSITESHSGLLCLALHSSHLYVWDDQPASIVQTLQQSQHAAADVGCPTCFSCGKSPMQIDTSLAQQELLAALRASA